MKFRPCIDIHDGKVKQIVGGTLKDNSVNVVENFVADMDADYYARMFMNDRLTGGHVIMLGPGNEEQAMKALNAYPEGLQIGGGITSENAASYLENGASHVIVTSYVFRDGDINLKNLDRIISEIGKEKLVLDLSCKKVNGTYYVATDRWQKLTQYPIDKENLKQLSGYCAEFLVHAVDVEGKRKGIQEELVSNLGTLVEIPVTYAGGARSIEDIELVKKLGKNKIDITIGSALDIFGGTLSYNEIISWFKNI